MGYPFYTLDVFTTTKFSGNPLAVIMAADDLSLAAMQNIAREFNLAESIFVLKPEKPENRARVRIFTTNYEMPFAGHPTIGCAILLASLDHPTGDFETTVILEENAGLVPVKVKRQGGDILAQFTAPVIPYALGFAMPPRELLAKALDLDSADIGFAAHQPQALEGGPRFLHVPLASRSALAKARAVEPYWSELKAGMAGIDSAYLYTPDDRAGGLSYSARMLSPGCGVPEDPATGSATALLAAQFLTYDRLGDGTHQWGLTQGEDMGRPSQLYLEADVAGNELVAVRVAGSAVQLMAGDIAL